MIIRLLLLLAMVGCKAGGDNEVKPDLIGGRDAKPGEFPEVVRIRTGGASCTGTVVGPRALLTAAHCVGNGDTTRFTGGDGVSYTAKCTRHPSYPRQDMDVAMCYMNKDYSGRFKASIGKAAIKGDTTTLMGYGCTRPGGGGGNDGTLRVGNAEITGFSNYDFVASRGAALCFGDSGGPAMAHIKDPFEEHHWVIGVNSKGNIRTVSYLTRTDHSAIASWIREWTKGNSTEVCGVNKECDPKPEPEPEPSPEPSPEPEPEPEPSPEPEPGRCGELFLEAFAKMTQYKDQCTL